MPNRWQCSEPELFFVRFIAPEPLITQYLTEIDQCNETLM